MLQKAMSNSLLNNFVIEYRDAEDWERSFIPFEHSVGALSSAWTPIFEQFRETVCSVRRDHINNTIKYSKDETSLSGSQESSGPIVRCAIPYDTEDDSTSAGVQLFHNSEFFNYRCSLRNEQRSNNLGEQPRWSRIPS